MRIIKIQIDLKLDYKRKWDDEEKIRKVARNIQRQMQRIYYDVMED